MLTIKACNPDGGAFKYILTGIGNAFRKAGLNFSHVQGKQVSPDFDLYLGCSGWPQAIPPKNTRKGLVGIHVNPYGRRHVGSVEKGPVIDEPASVVEWTIKQQPDFVFCYCSQAFIDDYYGFYTSKHGIPVVPMPTAADITIYYPRPVESRFKCDIGWVGGYWPYKAIMLDRYLKPLFGHNCQIYGWGNTWRNSRVIDDNDVPALFSTAKICPSVSESHSVPHPVDVPERLFKVPASGGFTIHTPSPAIPDFFGDVVPMAKDVHHWKDLVGYYLSHDNERIALAKKQYEAVTAKHTYFDRCMGIARLLATKSSAWSGVEEMLLSAKNSLLASR